MSYSLLIFFCLCVKFIYAVKDCSSPWEKVNDNICLLLNSNIKTWNHAKISCNHYGGDLLYIDNELEKTQTDDFLNTLLRYRFNLKPFAWLDAKKKSEEWIWSHNNQSVLYSNWAANLNPNNSPQLNCACIRLRDKTWRPCDCFTKQHYICRKTDRLEETKTNQNLPLQTITMEPQVSKVASNDDLSQDEKSIIVSSLVLMNDEDARKAGNYFLFN
ncbi:unnamed protein product [Brachionus calyciflorus]|uniref:C-type lectin domain-containing protein n=1 Tax=Brachionus calyciflorus TaxID=104777 RepID=A0A813SJV9_9BILA|nr:unnamed protein product [Brachionus calyciflorus]